jgi:hypothetical protein
MILEPLAHFPSPQYAQKRRRVDWERGHLVVYLPYCAVDRGCQGIVWNYDFEWNITHSLLPTRSKRRGRLGQLRRLVLPREKWSRKLGGRLFFEVEHV